MDITTIAKVLGEQLDISDVSTITPDSRIIEDLGADSLDVVELLITLDDEYNIKIADEEIASIKTVGDLIKIIETRS